MHGDATLRCGTLSAIFNLLQVRRAERGAGLHGLHIDRTRRKDDNAGDCTSDRAFFPLYAVR